MKKYYLRRILKNRKISKKKLEVTFEKVKSLIEETYFYLGLRSETLFNQLEKEEEIHVCSVDYFDGHKIVAEYVITKEN